MPNSEWLGWKDLNLRMPESKSGALDHFATPHYYKTVRTYIHYYS